MAFRKRTTRTSLTFCEENFSCREEKCEAIITCTDCRTSQCESCDASLHANERHRYHERRAIVKPDSNELCKQGSCESKNYADVWCDECRSSYCYTCDDARHRQKRKSHRRIKFVPKSEVASGRASGFQDLSEKEQQSHNNDANSEDSSHFVSLPLSPLVENDSNMHLLESCHSNGSKTSLPDIVDNHVLEGNSQQRKFDESASCFVLVDTNESIQVKNGEEFVEKLTCRKETSVKVVSIFGNTGDGKSHTLNHTFFGGKEVFQTSITQESCTVGVWAAFDSVHNVIVIDTEGLLGISTNANRRTRLLLKILAISDIVIYRTRAERLHDDLFKFLGDASAAYTKHFTKELKSCMKKCNLQSISSLGPSVIIFHETMHTNTLDQGLKAGKPSRVQDKLKQVFHELEIDISAFSSVDYVGTKTVKPPTDFNPLLNMVRAQLENNSVRSHRKPEVVFQALQALNDKFNGEIEPFCPLSFPDQYFTCTARCLSCGCRCQHTMNHELENVNHKVDKNCRYQHQYENKIYLCKVCLDSGNRIEVVPKAHSSKQNTWIGLAAYAWSGYVLECPNCGIIYQSRQYWYGNEDPDKVSVRTEICHVWPDGNTVVQGTHNAARRLLDGLTYVSDSIATVSSKPAKAVGSWVTDQIAPAYWVPNSHIKKCNQCSTKFTEMLLIHHCRACGYGFCDSCSSRKRPVPERGWGEEPVRVCDNCFYGSTDLTDSSNSEGGECSQVTLRKSAEVVGSTVASIVSIPLDALKESTRPSYWIPDHEIKQCFVCKEEFSPVLKIHHCRACGQGVCSSCSPHQKPVPSRGWDNPVRVCRICMKKTNI